MADHQWALAIAAAAPVAASRPDILEANGFEEPASWDDMLELVRAGLVAFAGLPLDCLMHWYSLCINEGQTPFTAAATIVDKEVGMAALGAIKELPGRQIRSIRRTLSEGECMLFNSFVLDMHPYAADEPFARTGLVHRPFGARATVFSVRLRL